MRQKLNGVQSIMCHREASFLSFSFFFQLASLKNELGQSEARLTEQVGTKTVLVYHLLNEMLVSANIWELSSCVTTIKMEATK